MRWMTMVGLLAALWACDDETPGARPGSDRGADRGPTADAATDGGPTADAAADQDPGPDAGGDWPPAEPLPAQPQPELIPVAAEAWRVALIGNQDPVLARAREDRLSLPEPGEDADGLFWDARSPDAEGLLGELGRRLAWAITRLELDAPTHLVVQADAGLQVFTAGKTMPGDVYRSGKLRVPFTLDAGEATLAVRGLGGRGPLRVRLWRSAAPIHLNVEDRTVPDWPAGTAHVQWLGLPALNFGPERRQVVARVLEGDHFEASATVHLSLPGETVTQLAFELIPKAPLAEGSYPVTLQVELPGPGGGRAGAEAVSVTLELAALPPGEPWRRARRSRVDGSVQYAGVRSPPDPAAGQALVISLHGAGVEAIGQARAYSPKDFAWIVAPTNRRPFGFDWEDWGRLDALEATDDAMGLFETDPSRTYLTGHSMGGHGTWHLGVNDPQRFAVVGPSAGWSDFWNYARDNRPAGLFARSQAYSFTLNYVSNLAERAAYLIHGTADDNVPFSEGERMYAACDGVVDHLDNHWQEGAGHWWDGDAAEGADCVDWPDLFALMEQRRLPAFETDFSFTSPGAWYSRPYHYVTLGSATSPLADLQITSARSDDQLSLDTRNVRSLTLDGDWLQAAGITQVTVDGEPVPVAPGPLPWGPQTGKRPGVHGPLNEAFYRPWCLVVADRPPATYLAYARYLIAYWAHIGNGQGCLLRQGELDDAIRAERNLIYIGLDRADLPAGPDGITWDDMRITINGRELIQGALLAVFPEGERLSAILTTTAFDEDLLWGYVPFASASSYPDFLVFSGQGGLAAGFFDGDWRFSAATSAP